MSGRRRALVAAAAAGLALAGRPSPARAQTTLELLPSLTAGMTSNAELVGAGTRDEFTIASVFGRLQLRGPRASATIGTHLSLTHFFQGNGSDGGTAELMALTTFTLTQALELHLFGSGILSRTSQIGTIGLLTPQAATAGSSVYLSTNAGEDLSWQATTAWRLSEAFAFSQVSYPFEDSSTRGHRTTTSLTGGGRADYALVRDTFSLDVRATELLFGHGFALDGTELFAETSWLGQALLGWRRELSLAWSSDLDVGAAYMSNGDAPDVWVPAGRAMLGYRHLTWFATIEVSQAPVTNMLTALATINDTAYLRLTLPISERELAAVSAFAGLIYARGADAQGNLYRAYDQQSIGGRFSMLIGRLPLSGSIEYSFVNQNGGPGFGTPTPDLMRHTVMLTLTGAMAWGPNTPPLLDSGRVMLGTQQ